MSRARWCAIFAVSMALGGASVGGSSYVASVDPGHRAAAPAVLAPGYGAPVSDLQEASPATVNELEAAQAAREPQRVTGSFIVALAPGQDPHEVAMSIARDYGGEAGAVYGDVINGFQFLGPDDAGKKMASDPRIRGVQPDYVAHTAESSASRHLKADDAPCVTSSSVTCPTPDWYTLPYKGANTRVAILDTGADLSHPDIAGNIDTALSTDASGSVCDAKSGTGQDQNGHGTRTTSNAVGKIGVAPEATAVVVKVFPGSGSSTTFAHIACGVNYVVHLNRDTPTKVVAVNASIAGSGSAGSCTDGNLRQAVCQLVNGTDIFSGNTPIGAPKWAQAVFFAAAGNSNVNASGTVPARYPDAIAVSAFDCDAVDCNTSTPKLASFSNDGATIGLGAPGVGILSAKLGGSHETASGTSRSSPQATGAAAVLVSAGVPVDQIRTVLETGGRCPTANVTKDVSGNCTTGTWASDGDGSTEPFLDVEDSINAFTPPEPMKPSAPTNVTAVAGDGQATVSWAPSNPNGSPIDHYTVTRSPGNVAKNTADGSTTSLIFDSLLNGTAYTFTVTATNGIGTSDASAASSPVTPQPATPPGPPTNVTAIPGNGQATVSWAPPSSDGGSPITSFTVTSSPGGVTATTADGSQTSIAVGPLTNGTPYTFTVVATNQKGSGSPSAPSAAVTPTESTVFYSQDFDVSPASGWTVSGSSSTVRWHLTNECGANSHATGLAVWYGRNSTCTYSTGSSSNSGTLTSPVVSGTPAHYQITFLAKRAVESCSGCTRDQTYVEVNFQDGGGWRRIYYADAGHNPSSANNVCTVPTGTAFQPITCTIGNATGKVQVRYVFKTTTATGNGFFGWSIDDFFVRS